MLIVQVHVCVKPESAAAFKKATVENARSSIQEPGIARFDVLEQQDDATRFVLIEVYRTPEAVAAHNGRPTRWPSRKQQVLNPRQYPSR